MIPPVLHQIWIGPKPYKYQQFADKFKELNPNWTYVLWGNEILGNVSSELMPYVTQARSWAQKADILRYWIIFNQGGVFMDTDFEPLKSFDFVLERGAFVARASYSKKHCTCALFGSVQCSKFMSDVLTLIPQRFNPNIGNSVGARVITEAARRNKVYEYPTEVFYPLTWEMVTNKQKPSNQAMSKAAAIHHFEASWI